jgi:tripartite-type tricarboxylate transporter receptor subunit TctC
MKPMSFLKGLAAATAFGLVTTATMASEQAFPSKQITVVVPFAAGGPSDVIARIVTEHMSKTLGQPIIIENVGGAGGTTGSARVAASTADGYTLLSGSMGSHVAAPVLTPNLKYDSAKDFEPVGLTLDAPAVIVVKKSLPVNNLKEFVAYMKANGDKVSQGHGGVGASSHMACLLFTSQAGVKPSVVAYRGSGPALNDVVAGQIDFVCDQTMGMTGQINGGTVKALVVASNERSPALPNVPSAKEAGFPEYQLSIWSGIFAPKGTPKDVVAKLNAAIGKALEDKDTRKRLEELGGSIPAKSARTPEHLANLMKKEMTRWQPILKVAAASSGPSAPAPTSGSAGAPPAAAVKK